MSNNDVRGEGEAVGRIHGGRGEVGATTRKEGVVTTARAGTTAHPAWSECLGRCGGLIATNLT